MIEIFGAKLLSETEFLSKKTEFLNRLPIHLLDKFNKFSHHKNLQRSVFGELLSRNYFAQYYKTEANKIIYEYGEKGKPYLPDSDIYFNISHSGEWVIAAFANNHIGIDIELIREPNYAVAKRFFSKEEIEQLNVLTDSQQKKELFFDFWTIKESYLKTIGTGLTKPLNTFTVIKTNNIIQLTDNENYNQVFIKQYDFDKDYKLSVCSFESDFNSNVKIIDF